MNLQELEVFIPGKTQIGEMIKVDILLRNGQRLILTDELRKFRIRTGLFSIEMSGKFNYLRIFKLTVDIIRFNIITPEVMQNEERIVEDTGSGDREEGIRELDSEMANFQPDKKRKGSPYNI